MAGEDLFHETLKEFIKVYDTVTHKVGTAVNVSGSKCDVEIEGEPALYDVRFHAIEDTLGNKIVIKPKDGSKVIVGVISNLATEAFIEQCSEIDEVLIIADDKQYKLNSSGHLIKGGDDTLKQVIDLVIEAVQVIVVIQGRNPDQAKLLAAKQKLENILQ